VRLAILVVGLMSSTVVLLLGVLYQRHWAFTLSVVLQVLPILLTRDEFAARRWYYPFWLAWSGASLLGAGWLEVSEGLKAEPVFVSFGPGYLIMAVMAVVWPAWFGKRETKVPKER
jgi:hypothetical protein